MVTNKSTRTRRSRKNAFEIEARGGIVNAGDDVNFDPTTNRRMRVWIDPVDGQRHYVPEG